LVSPPKVPTIQPNLLSAFREAVADRYLVHEVVGVGGMATVFKATRREDGRIVAIKVLDAKLQEVLGHERFRREIGILSRLEHPGILPLFESRAEAGFLYFVMPLVTGATLRERLRAEPQLPIDQAVSLTTTVLDALEYAHGQNVVHRDIKPENILIQDGQPLVADFGIARAIVVSGGEAISSTGFVIGTPSYMSPEQAAGESRLDARSDVYAMGCLLYEMLAGQPPFTGTTAQVIQARHLHEAPPPLRVARPTVHPALEAVIGKALAKVPADRYGSAAQFSRELKRALTAPPVRPTWKTRVLVWATAAVLLLGLATALVLRGPARAVVDPERYLVLPFRQHGSAAELGLSGSDYARLVWQTLGRKWRDLRLVDEAVVEDRLRQSGDSSLSLSGGLELARSLGAGLLVRGEVERLGDSIRVQASLYRTDRGVGDAVQRGEAVFPAALLAGPAASSRVLLDRLSELARGLVLPALGAAADQATLTATPYFQALRATLSGDSALVNWNLELARQRYREAFAIDPGYAAPRLHFAQASLWADAPVTEWRPAAEAALAATSELSTLERLEAEGLVALGRGEFPRACQRFRSVITRDSLRFAGWFGLGECLTTDSLVVPDSLSPSGWRFRGKYADGIAAYIRALSLVPLAHLAYGGEAAVARLAHKFYAESDRRRVGLASTDASRFAAVPALESDSIVTVPWPIEEVMAGKHLPATARRALEGSRKQLRELTGDWLNRYPNSPAALEAHAWALELSAELDSPDPRASALALVRRLRALASTSGRKVELGAWQVRLLLKTRQFTAARLLVDSILSGSPATEREITLQAGLATLTGRVARAAQLAELSPETSYVLPTGALFQVSKLVGAASQRLLIYAAAGMPVESVQVAAARVARLVQRDVEPARQAKVLEAVLYQPSLLAFPALPPPDGRLRINQIEAAIAGGDTVGARSAFAALAVVRESQLSTVAPDHLVLEARLLALIGDSAGARHRLETLLDDLTGLSASLFEWPVQAAALPRAMALYRVLAGDPKSRAVDSALTTLWKHADPDLLTRVRK
jgi:hypothetical protein